MTLSFFHVKIIERHSISCQSFFVHFGASVRCSTNHVLRTFLHSINIKPYRTVTKPGFKGYRTGLSGVLEDISGRYVRKERFVPLSRENIIQKSIAIAENESIKESDYRIRERMPLRYSPSWIRPMAKTFLPASFREAPQ